jgi:hypothetical protein
METCPGRVAHTCQVLDYDYCSEYLHKVAKAQYSDPLHTLEWVEATP